MDTLTHLFASPYFMPHGHCFLWKPLLLWAYVLSDVLIALSYYSIPVALWQFVRRRPDLPFSWIFVMFAVFIFACGTTHLVAIWTLWQPVYWLDASIKMATATVSMVTATLLWPLLPKTLSLPSPMQLARANHALRSEINARSQIEEQLQTLNNELEYRVAQRTAELEAINTELRQSMANNARIEQSLRYNEALLRAIINNATAVIYIKQLNGRYLLVNQHFEDLFHVTQANMLDKTDYDLFTREQASAFRAIDEQVAATGKVVEAEEIATLDDGLHTYISIKFPIHDVAGQLYAVGGISTDITERQRTAQALRDNEEHTRLIVDTALDAVITIDHKGLITGWNPQAERTFGWPRAKALGRPLTETIIPATYREAHVQGLRRYLATGEEVVLHKRLEMVALHHDGHEFPIELAITPILSSTNIGFGAFVRDITDRKQQEAHLENALKEKNVLLAEIHHRVKNNLQIISSLLDLQLGSTEDPLLRNLLRENQNRIRSMAEIHQQLYESHNFSRVDFGSILDTLAPTLMDSYAVRPEQIALVVEVEEILLPLNAGIPCALIANELISNALKHAFPDGRSGKIEVKLSRAPDGQLLLVIADNGIPVDLVLEEATTLGLQLVTLLTSQIGGRLAIQRTHPTQISVLFSAEK